MKIIQPLYPPSMKFSQIDSKISSFFPQLEELIVFNRFLTEKLEPLCIEKWPNAANVLKRIQDKTAEMQLKGEWTLHSFNEPLYYKGAIMVFSTCRSLDELKKCPRPIAPFPEELVIVIFITDFSEEHLKHEWPDKERMYIGPFLEYWHYAGYSIKSLKDVRVFYGDDVTHETLDKIPPIIKTLFPPCNLPGQP